VERLVERAKTNLNIKLVNGHFDKPNCVEKTANMLGKSKVGGRLSQLRFKDGTGQEHICGTYSIKVSIHL
jgi:hypothetical protein